MFFKNYTSMLIVLLLLFVTLNGGGGRVAYANTTAEKIEQIQTSIVAIETAIDTSKNFTAIERATLQASLDGVKVALAQLPLTGASQDDVATTTLATTTTAVTQNEIAYIIAKYVPEKNEVSATVTYATSSKKEQEIVTFTFPQLATIKNFSTAFSQMRRLTISELARQLGVSVTEVSTSTLFTSRNPIRNRLLSFTEADTVAENIGTHSIINRILVTTGRTVGTIEVFSDQDEQLRVTITRNVSSARDDRKSYKVGTYNYAYEVYLRGPSDARSIGQDEMALPIISYTAIEQTEAQVLEALEDIFVNALHYDGVDNFPKKLLSFLTDNKTSFEIGNGVVFDDSLLKTNSCFTEKDQAVMNDFYVYSFTDSKIQVWPETDVFFLSPQIVAKKSGQYMRCINTKKVPFF